MTWFCILLPWIRFFVTFSQNYDGLYHLCKKSKLCRNYGLLRHFFMESFNKDVKVIPVRLYHRNDDIINFEQTVKASKF